MTGEVQLGIRPHDLKPGARSSNGGSIDVKVDDGYAVGREWLFNFQVEGFPMQGISPETIATGQVQQVAFDPGKLLLFSTDGERIRV